MRPLALPLATLFLAFAFARHAGAQCPLVYSSSGPQPELSGFAACSMLWDPDGAGPASQRLLVGGFVTAGSDALASAMTWNGSQWDAVGASSGDTFFALAEWNGRLVGGGDFLGNQNHVAEWTGSTWQPLGTGLPFMVGTLAPWNGSLVAFESTSSGSAIPPAIRQWDGLAWSAIPAPPALRHVTDALSFQGHLFVGGADQTGQGVLERWNGTSWLASTFANGTIRCLDVRSFSLVSTLYVGGAFNVIGGVVAPHIASSASGAVWSPVGVGLPAPCEAMHVRATSALGIRIVARLAGPANPVMTYSGTTWAPMGNARLGSITYFNGVYHGTLVNTFDDACRRFDGTAWVPVHGPGLDGEVNAVTAAGNDVIVGGTFSSTAAGPMRCIARWDGAVFHPLGSGMTAASPPTVDALVTLPNGDVVAGGSFQAAGGVSANNIARWNGAAWSPLGNGIGSPGDRVLALCRMPNGDIVAGGQFSLPGGLSGIARWNGTVWSPLGFGLGLVRALAVGANGTLFAGGSFAGLNHIAQWDGFSWSLLGPGCNADVWALAVRPNGDVVAAGSFTTAGGAPVERCARWNGTFWAPMGGVATSSEPVRALLALPNGDIVAGKGLHGGLAFDQGLSRWNGSVWSTVGALEGYFLEHPNVRALALRAGGDVVAGGVFSVANGIVSYNLTSFASTCMPHADPYGAGCSSVTGPLVLVADTMPWLGTTFGTTTTGFAPFSLCLAVTGFSQVSIPLPAILPEGQPGCSLLASPDVLTVLLLDVNGAAHTALALPTNSSLLGAAFFQQSIALEFSGLATLTAVRGSNGLASTIGGL